MLSKVEKVIGSILTKHNIPCIKLLAIDSLMWLGFGLIYFFYICKSVYSRITSTKEKDNDLADTLNPIKIVAGVSVFAVVCVICLYLWRFVLA